MPTNPISPASPQSLSALLRPMASRVMDGLEAKFKEALPDGWAAIGATGARPLRNAADKVLSDVAARVLDAVSLPATSSGSRLAGRDTSPSSSGSSDSRRPGEGGHRGLLERVSDSGAARLAVQESVAAALEAQLGPGLAGTISRGAGHVFSGAMRFLAAHEAQRQEEAHRPAASQGGGRRDTPLPDRPVPQTPETGATPPAELDGTPREVGTQGRRGELLAPMSPADMARAGLIRRQGGRPAATPQVPGQGGHRPHGEEAVDASTQTHTPTEEAPLPGQETQPARQGKPADGADPAPLALPDPAREGGRRGDDASRNPGGGHGLSDHEASMQRMMEKQLELQMRQEIAQMERHRQMDQFKHWGSLTQEAGRISD